MKRYNSIWLTSVCCVASLVLLTQHCQLATCSGDDVEEDKKWEHGDNDDGMNDFLQKIMANLTTSRYVYGHLN